MRPLTSLLLCASLCSCTPFCHAQGDWLGGAPAATDTKPIDKTVDLLQAPVDMDGARAARVNLPADQISPSMVFSEDGKRLFLLQKGVGVLQIDMPAFQLKRTLALPADGGTIALSSEGLVVGSGTAARVWIVDSQTLQTKRSVEVPSSRFVTASPKTALFFVGDGDQSLSSVNALTSEVVTYKPSKYQFDIRTDEGRQTYRLSAFNSPLLSPDGKNFYCVADDAIFRFGVEGTELVADQNSDPLLNPESMNPRQLALSPDGRYIALPDGGGNYEGIGDGPPYQVFVFKSDSLTRPLLRLPVGAYPRVLAYDPVAARLYAPKYGVPVQVFTTQGTLEKSLMAPGAKGNGFDALGIAVHPGGRRVLVVGREQLIWYELPEAPK